jgi:hypothetical protein
MNLSAEHPAMPTISSINHALYYIRESTRIDLSASRVQAALGLAKHHADLVAQSPSVAGDILADTLEQWPVQYLESLSEMIRFRASHHMLDAIRAAIRVRSRKD